MGAGKSTLGREVARPPRASVRRSRRRDRTARGGADLHDLRDARRGRVPRDRGEARARGARLRGAGRDLPRRRRDGLEDDSAQASRAGADGVRGGGRGRGLEARPPQPPPTARRAGERVSPAVRAAAAAVRGRGGRARTRRRRHRAGGCRNRSSRRERMDRSSRRMRARSRSTSACSRFILRRRRSRCTSSAGRRSPTASVSGSALRLERGGTLVAIGGGTTTDVAGYVAATYLRGIPWIAVPTTLVGQVDAGDRRQDRHRPPARARTSSARSTGRSAPSSIHELLATLPAAERRNGMAEVVKTGLLAGEELWELPEPELVRRCAAFKAAVCLRDPRDEGERAMLNLGHTFAHALEAASEYALPHGEAVALGLTAALRLSDLPDDAARVEELLEPQPARVDAGHGVGSAPARQEGTRRQRAARAPGRSRQAAYRRRASGEGRAARARRPHRIDSQRCAWRC